MKRLIQIAFLLAFSVSSFAAQLFQPLLVVDSVNTLLTRVPITSESIIVLGTSAPFDVATRVAKNYPAGSYTVDGVSVFTALGGSVWRLSELASVSSISINTNTATGFADGTNILFLVSGSTAIPYVTGLQPSSATLSNLVANPNQWQATNANLTALASNPSLYQLTNTALTTLSTGNGSGLTNLQPSSAALSNLTANPSLYQATNAALTALASDPAIYQATNAALTTLVAGGTASNFFRGDKTYAAVTTNMLPGLVTDVLTIATNVSLKQIGSAALTNLAAGSGSGLTNVAMRGLGQPEVSGIVGDSLTGTRTTSLAQKIGTNDFSTWVRAKIPTVALGASPSPGIIKLSSNGAFIANSFDIYINSTNLWCIFWGPTSTANWQGYYFTGFQTANAGQIVDIVASRSGTNLTVYANGSNITATATLSTGGSPPGFGATVTSTRLDVGADSGTGGGVSYSQPIYRTAIFNRALSQSDVTSLVNNGIDPADQWGNSTVPVVSFSPSTLNGGFETNSLNASTTWATSVAGSSAITIDTSGTLARTGANAAKIAIDPSDSTAVITANNGGNVVAANARYRASIWARKDASTAGSPILKAEAPSGTTVLTTAALTTTYAQTIAEFTSSAAGVFRVLKSSGTASSTNYMDDVELTRIGAILDLDFTGGYSSIVPDRSSNLLTATNYGGVTYTLPQTANYLTNTTITGNLSVSGTTTINGALAVTGTETVSLLTVTNSTTLGDLTVRTNIAGLTFNSQSLLVTNASVFRGQITTASNILYSTLPITVSSAITNWIVDFTYPMNTLQVTTNVFLVSSAAKPASATNYVQTLVRLRGGANVQTLGMNASWLPLGTAATSIPANKIVMLKVIAWGNNETNVTVEATTQP